MENNIEIIIEPHNDDYDPSDNRWLAQVNDLVSDCEREVGEVRKDVTPVEGQKGGVESLILTLGSAGALTAAVDIFKGWIARDRNRSLKLKITTPEGVQEWEVSGNAMDKEVIEQFMKAALNKEVKNSEKSD